MNRFKKAKNNQIKIIIKFKMMMSTKIKVKNQIRMMHQMRY